MLAKGTEPSLQTEIKHLKSIGHLSTEHTLSSARWTTSILTRTFWFCFTSTWQIYPLKVGTMKYNSRYFKILCPCHKEK